MVFKNPLKMFEIFLKSESYALPKIALMLRKNIASMVPRLCSDTTCNEITCTIEEMI